MLINQNFLIGQQYENINTFSNLKIGENNKNSNEGNANENILIIKSKSNNWRSNGTLTSNLSHKFY